jgi:hypothetical protein
VILDRIAMGVRGCWIYTGTLDSHGYPQRIMVNYRRILPQHWMVEQVGRPVPKGLTTDHLCKTPRCINPDHLEVVSRRINTLRSDNPAAQNARKTHCLRGHELAGSNLYVTPDERRQCKTCRRLSDSKGR